eukprot:2016410-Pleurochrysis_carterae.AAC.4
MICCNTSFSIPDIAVRHSAHTLRQVPVHLCGGGDAVAEAAKRRGRDPLAAERGAAQMGLSRDPLHRLGRGQARAARLFQKVRAGPEAAARHWQRRPGAPCGRESTRAPCVCALKFFGGVLPSAGLRPSMPACEHANMRLRVYVHCERLRACARERAREFARTRACACT